MKLHKLLLLVLSWALGSAISPSPRLRRHRHDMVNRKINPVVVYYISEMKEINISVTYFCHGQERSKFWFSILDFRFENYV